MNINQLMRIVPFMVIAMIASCLTSCSDDDNNGPEVPSIEEQVAKIKSIIMDDKGELVFIPSSRAGNYLLPAAKAEEAQKICSGLLIKTWDGKSAEILNLGEYGSVKLNPTPKAGVYAELLYNVKDIPVFKLEVATFQYCADENRVFMDGGYYPYWECTSCHKWFANKHPDRCPSCGGTSFRLVKSDPEML